MYIGDTTLEFRVLSYDKGVCFQGGNVKDVAPQQHHGPPLRLTLADLGANHLAHGVYISFGLIVVCDDFFFFFFFLEQQPFLFFLTWLTMVRLPLNPNSVL